MKKFLRFPLNIQTFADGEGDNGAQQSTSQMSNAPQIDYEKLAEVVSKRSAGTEDKVLQGYFKQQGLTQEDAAQAISEYCKYGSRKQESKVADPEC